MVVIVNLVCMLWVVLFFWSGQSCQLNVGRVRSRILDRFQCGEISQIVPWLVIEQRKASSFRGSICWWIDFLWFGLVAYVQWCSCWVERGTGWCGLSDCVVSWRQVWVLLAYWLGINPFVRILWKSSPYPQINRVGNQLLMHRLFSPKHRRCS